MRQRATGTPEMTSVAKSMERESLPLPISYPLLLAALAVSLAAYATSLKNGFVFDDEGQVLANPWIRNVRFIPEIFSSGVWDFQARGVTNYYRPLMHVIYLVSYQLFGLAPWGFHLVNVLLHAGVCLLVFLLTNELVRNRPASPLLSPPFVATVLFAVHPVHTEVVSWVAGVPEASFALFGLLSLLLYIRARRRAGGAWSYLWSVISFSLATLCKETALTLPVLFVAYEAFVDRSTDDLRARAKRIVPYLLVAVGYLALRLHVLGGFAPKQENAELTASQFAMNVLPMFSRYLEKLLLPIHLNAWPVFHPIPSLATIRGIVSLAAAGAFLTAAAVAFKRDRVVFFGLLVFLVPLLPAFYLPGISGGKFSERYLYLPSVGFVIIVAWVIAAWARGSRAIIASTAALALITALYVAGTIRRSAVWRDSFTFWSDVVEKSPDGAPPHYSLANVLRQRGDVAGAMRHYQMALSLNPSPVVASSAYNNLGYLYQDEGRVELALEHYRTAIRLWPENGEAHSNLGIILAQRRQLDEAIEQFRMALKLRPNDAEAHYNLGLAYRDKGRMDDAIAEIETAVRLNPGDRSFGEELTACYQLKRDALH